MHNISEETRLEHGLLSRVGFKATFKIPEYYIISNIADFVNNKSRLKPGFKPLISENFKNKIRIGLYSCYFRNFSSDPIFDGTLYDNYGELPVISGGWLNDKTKLFHVYLWYDYSKEICSLVSYRLSIPPRPDYNGFAGI